MFELKKFLDGKISNSKFYLGTLLGSSYRTIEVIFRFSEIVFLSITITIKKKNEIYVFNKIDFCYSSIVQKTEIGKSINCT